MKRFHTVSLVAKTMTEWETEAGMSPGLLFARLKRGLAPAEALDHHFAHVDERRTGT